MRQLFLGFMLILLLGACATGRQAGGTASEGQDANAEFARDLQQAESETFEGRVEAKLADESRARGGGPGAEIGMATEVTRRESRGPGIAFYVYAAIGVLLLMYLAYLLGRRSHSSVRVKY